MPTVTCFGEVLWDIFPTHKKIGGAPLNVALRLNSFGVKTFIISKIGDDNNGKELLQYLFKSGIETSVIQLDKTHRTGCVTVILDDKGSASYEIEYPVAWDKIEVRDNAIEAVKNSDAFIFGSLASRDETTKKTLYHLLKYSSFKVFDVNLRPPFYSIELLLALMKEANLIKFNNEELNEICNALNFTSESLLKQIEFLSNYTHTNQICVTKGKDGAVFLYNNQFYFNTGYPVKIVDTVGAGDSFLASLISKLLENINPQEALDFASAVGTIVVGRSGANPKISKRDIRQFIKP